MRRGWFFLLALSIGLNVGLIISDFRESHPGGERALPPQHAPRVNEGAGHIDRMLDDHLERMTEHLNLSDEQKSDMGVVLGRFLPQIVSQEEEVRRARRALADYYIGRELKPDEFAERVHSLHRSQGKLDSLVGEAMLAEGLELSPEQRRKYMDVMPWRPPAPPPPRARS